MQLVRFKESAAVPAGPADSADSAASPIPAGPGSSTPAGSAAPASGGRTRVGVEDRGGITELGVGSVAELLRLSADEMRKLLEGTSTGSGRSASDVTLAVPIDGLTEVWAAGVTYRRSEEARVEETEGAAAFYQAVYRAERPELFFKSVAWRVAGSGEAVSLRGDSTIDVPEPELAAVCNRYGEVVGYTVVDDLSSRDIEGVNPLYLPQAKVWLGSCALGPAIRPAWEIQDPYRLGIRLRIWRQGSLCWEGEANTAELNRRIEELVSYLFRENTFPDGVVLSTGTCLVPEMPFSLQDGDRVDIAIDEVGELSNPVVRGAAKLAWAEARTA